MSRPSKPTITRLGQALRKKRDHLSTVGAGDQCGVPGSTLTKIERGAHRPSYDTALKLARWLGWTVEQVMEAAGEAAELQAGPGEVEP